MRRAVNKKGRRREKDREDERSDSTVDVAIAPPRDRTSSEVMHRRRLRVR